MYLTATEAQERLQTRYNFEAILNIGDVMLASLDLDELAPFKGEKTDSAQVREFPRDGETETPDAVLDWVALRAHQMGADEREGVTRRRVGEVSIEHAPGFSRTVRHLRVLLDPYLQRTGVRV